MVCQLSPANDAAECFGSDRYRPECEGGAGADHRHPYPASDAGSPCGGHPQYLQHLSNAGAQRALPSAESNLFANQRLRYGNAYLLGQYLQPLLEGGPDTFQRLPEVGYSLPNLSLFNSPLLLGGDTNAVYFFREEGFTENRFDFLPGLSTD